MNELIAKAIAVTELPDEEIFLISMYDNLENPQDGIEFQKSLGEIDDQDRDLGMDSYCISTSFGSTDYGGLASCVLNQTSLNLRFNPEEGKILGFPDGLRIHLETDPTTTEALRDGLARIFDQDRCSPAELNLRSTK